MASPEIPEVADLVALLRSGGVPVEIRRFAARRDLPLDRDDQTRALLTVLGDEDLEVAAAAQETLGAMPPDELAAFVSRPDTTAEELESISLQCGDGAVLEQVIRHKDVDDATLARLARVVTGGPQEAFVINQVRLLRNPTLIDALFENPDLTTDARRRLLEVREEFFEKETRKKEADEIRGVDELRLAQEIAEAEVEEKRVKREAGEAAAIAKADLESSLTTGAAYRRIAVMTVSEKIKLAYSGGKEERRILMSDANKLVGAAVLKSRGLTIAEIESFCSMRHLDEEIFRKIAGNREWIRKPAVISALVKNPKVNLAITLPLVKRLMDRDLKAIVRDPNLAEGIRIASRKVIQERRK